MIRVAVIGAGHWGPNLIGNFHTHRRSEVAWVVDRSEARLDAVKAEFERAARERVGALPGVEAVSVGRNAWAFIASPLRAIADAVYLNKEITWNQDGFGYLTESLRMEEGDLQSLSFASLDEMLDSLRSRRVHAYLKGLKGAVNRAG